MFDERSGSAEQEAVETVEAPHKRTLYDISVDYSDLEQLMDSIDGDITPDDEERIAEFLKDLDKDRDTKFDNYGGLIKEWEALGNAQQDEGKRIARLGEIKLNKAKYLKLRLLGFFQFHNITTAIETLRFKFRRQANGGKLSVVVNQEYLDAPETLPAEFTKTVVFPDMDKIREALEGADEEAKTLAATVAHIAERGEHLRVS